MPAYPDLHTQPLKTGLLWGAMFIPVFILFNRATQGRWFSLEEVGVLIPAALASGVLWAFVQRRILAKENPHAG